MSLPRSCKLWPYALAIVIFAFIQRVQGETMVSVAIMADGVDGTDLIRGGDTVTFLCNIIDFPAENIVSIVRTSSGNSETLYSNVGQPGDVPENIEFRGFTEPQLGNRIYTLIINDVTKFDSGMYSCVVFNTVTFVPVDGKLELNIQYLPDPMYPACSIQSEDTSLTRYEDEQVMLRCETEVGNPEVVLDWKLSGRVIRDLEDVIQDGIKYLDFVVILQPSHNGKTFDCVMLAGLDNNYKPMCSIGPFNIQQILILLTSPKWPTDSITSSPDQMMTTLHPNSSPGSLEQTPIGPIRTTRPDYVSSRTTINTISNLNLNQTSGLGISKPSGLSSGTIALICIIIIIIVCIALVFGVVYLKRNNKSSWAPPDIKIHAADTTDRYGSNANLTDFKGLPDQDLEENSDGNAYLINVKTLPEKDLEQNFDSNANLTNFTILSDQELEQNSESNDNLTNAMISSEQDLEDNLVNEETEDTLM